jgi:hypothetical protein
MNAFTQEQIEIIREIVRQEIQKHDDEEEEDILKGVRKELDQLG